MGVIVVFVEIFEDFVEDFWFFVWEGDFFILCIGEVVLNYFFEKG